MKDIVIVPVYNEAATLEAVLDRIARYHTGTILAIDDGSTDGSSAILDTRKDIKALRHSGNRGYGASLISGFQYAIDGGFDRLVTIDCDEQHEPALIPRMFKGLEQGMDVLSGSRYLHESPRNDTPPPERRKVNIAITEEINRLTGFGLTDAFCGFKGYRVAALARLSLDEPGYAMPLQFWIQAGHRGLSVKEIAAPRIYKNLDRTFGGALDDAGLRLAYYRRVMENEQARWSTSSLSELTRTT